MMERLVFKLRYQAIRGILHAKVGVPRCPFGESAEISLVFRLSGNLAHPKDDARKRHAHRSFVRVYPDAQNHWKISRYLPLAAFP